MSEQRRNFLTRITTSAGVAVAGYLSATPATAASMRALNGEVSVLDFMSPGMRDDALSAALSHAHSAAIQGAFDSGAAVVELPASCVFRLTRPLKIG